MEGFVNNHGSTLNPTPETEVIHTGASTSRSVTLECPRRYLRQIECLGFQGLGFGA